MSTKTEVKAGKLDTKLLCDGIERYLKSALVAQGFAKSDCVVTLSREGGIVKMHGSERTEANFAVVSFSDTQYQIGINEKDGEISYVFDSWVDGGNLRKRVDGHGARTKGTNLAHCEGLERARKFATSKGRSFGVEFLKEGGAKAFVPHAG